MSRKKRRRVRRFLNELIALGVLTPQQMDSVDRALKRLERAQRSGNRRDLDEAGDEIARTMFRVNIENARSRIDDAAGD